MNDTVETHHECMFRSFVSGKMKPREDHEDLSAGVMRPTSDEQLTFGW